MAEGLMLLRPRNVLDHACDVDSDTNVRKEGSRGKNNVKEISMLLPIAILDQNDDLVQ